MVETFSTTDLRDCPVAQMRSWLGTTVKEFKKKVAEYRQDGSKPIDVAVGAQVTTDGDTVVGASAAAASNEEKPPVPWEMVTCSFESTLGEVIEKAAANHVHRLWVVDDGEEENGVLRGVVSLTDVLRVAREATLGEDREMQHIIVLE